MHYKQAELEKIENLLKSSQTRFIIEYWDRARNEPTSYRFTIGDGNQTLHYDTLRNRPMFLLLSTKSQNVEWYKINNLEDTEADGFHEP